MLQVVYCCAKVGYIKVVSLSFLKGSQMFYTSFCSETTPVLLSEESFALFEATLPGFVAVGIGYAWLPLDGENEMVGVDRFRRVLESHGGTSTMLPGVDKVCYLTPVLLNKDQSRWAPEKLQRELALANEDLESLKAIQGLDESRA